MPRRPSPTHRWLTAATWPVGIALTSLGYLWRVTPLHRSETLEPPSADHLPPPYPDEVDSSDVQPVAGGAGPLFHRLYSTRIRGSRSGPDALFAELTANLNRAAPVTFARFQRVLGDQDTVALGDEYVVRMPGPWDGPVRVIDRTPRSFRLATLQGHLEAGQIEFRVGGTPEMLSFEIESWARSGDRASNLLYARLGMAKEVQLHMWISFLEGVARRSGGKMTGGITIDTHRVEEGFD